MTERGRAFAVASLSLAIAFVLNLGVTRGARIVGWDAYHYISLARQYADELPTHLGGFYPSGYPLLGSLFVRLGAHPYFALVLVSALAYFALVFVLAVLVAREARNVHTVWFVPVLSFVPTVFFFAFDTMSEMTFSLFVLLAVTALANSARPKWNYVLGAFILLAFTTRYAGIFLVPACAAWLLYSAWRSKTPLSHGLFALSLVGVVILGLLYSNILATGYVSGSPRLAGTSPGAGLFVHMADFGLGAPGLIAGGLVALIDRSFLLHMVLGLGLFVTLIGIGLRAIFAPSSKWHGPAGMVLVCYPAAMVALQSINAFDSLSSGRFFLPLLAPLYFVLAGTIRLPRIAHYALPGVFVVLGLAIMVRGISAATYVDVTHLYASLNADAPPDARVFVSQQASSLAAYWDGPVVMVEAYRGDSPGEYGAFKRATQRGDNREDWLTVKSGDYLGVAATRIGRTPTDFVFDAAWAQMLDQIEAEGSALFRYSGEDSVLAEFVPQANRAAAPSEGVSPP